MPHGDITSARRSPDRNIGEASPLLQACATYRKRVLRGRIRKLTAMGGCYCAIWFQSKVKPVIGAISTFHDKTDQPVDATY
jgi:hypothetical protein